MAFAAGAGGCGDDDSTDAIATVGGVSIPRSALEDRLAASDRVRRSDPEGATDLPPRAQLKRDFTRALIKSEWVAQEAERHDLDVSDEAISEWVDAQRADFEIQVDPRTAAADVAMRGGRLQARTAMLIEKLVAARTGSVPDADVRRYYERHREELGSPEIRTVNLVTAPTRHPVAKARAAISRGEDWRRVVRRYSVDDLPRGHRTKWVATTKGEFDAPLDRAVFRARKGVVTGPLRTRSGWYLFELTLIERGKPATLAGASEQIEEALATQRQAAASQEFERRLRRTYANQTTCVDDLEVPECGRS